MVLPLSMPIIFRDLNRNVATNIMVDSNLQRESILSSERTKAYKLNLDEEATAKTVALK